MADVEMEEPKRKPLGNVERDFPYGAESGMSMIHCYQGTANQYWRVELKKKGFLLVCFWFMLIWWPVGSATATITPRKVIYKWEVFFWLAGRH